MLKYYQFMKLNFSTLQNIVLDIADKTKDNRVSNITLINSRVFLISFSSYRKEEDDFYI